MVDGADAGESGWGHRESGGLGIREAQWVGPDIQPKFAEAPRNVRQDGGANHADTFICIVMRPGFDSTNGTETQCGPEKAQFRHGR